MRVFIPLVLLCAVATVVHAQGAVGGVAVDSATHDALACVDVTLRDSAGREVARTSTAPDGVFQFAAPDSGVYRLRFAIPNHGPIFGPTEHWTPASESARRYALAFGDPVPFSGRAEAADTAADATPWPVTTRDGPRYPLDLKMRGKQGFALLRFVIDSAGAIQPRSVVTVATTDPGFATSAREYLPRARFTPARRAGRPTCALMVERFTFLLSR